MPLNGADSPSKAGSESATTSGVGLGSGDLAGWHLVGLTRPRTRNRSALASLQRVRSKRLLAYFFCTYSVLAVHYRRRVSMSCIERLVRFRLAFVQPIADTLSDLRSVESNEPLAGYTLAAFEAALGGLYANRYRLFAHSQGVPSVGQPSFDYRHPLHQAEIRITGTMTLCESRSFAEVLLHIEGIELHPGGDDPEPDPRRPIRRPPDDSKVTIDARGTVGFILGSNVIDDSQGIASIVTTSVNYTDGTDVDVSNCRKESNSAHMHATAGDGEIGIELLTLLSGMPFIIFYCAGLRRGGLIESSRPFGSFDSRTETTLGAGRRASRLFSCIGRRAVRWTPDESMAYLDIGEQARTWWRDTGAAAFPTIDIAWIDAAPAALGFDELADLDGEGQVYGSVGLADPLRRRDH